MVTTTLNTHPEITCLNAIFGPKGWPGQRYAAKHQASNPIFQRLATLSRQWDDFDRRIADISGLHETIMGLFPEKSRIGFKHHIGPVHQPVTPSVIALKLPTVIVTRSNALAAFSSGLIAKATGQSFVGSGGPIKRAKVHFDEQEFAYFIPWWDAVYTHWETEVRNSDVSYLKIDYVKSRTSKGMQQIVSFLGLDPSGLGTFPTQKRNSDSMLDRFSNPETVGDYLRDNDLEHWLVEE